MRPAARLAAELEKGQRIEQYNDLVIAYNISRNGLLLWQALRHCRLHRLAIPDDLIARLGEYGDRLIAAAQRPQAGSTAFAAALDLAAGARGLTAWQRADNWRRKVRSLRMMEYLVRQGRTAKQAAQAEAARAGMAPAVLAKDYSTFKPKMPRDAADWTSPHYYAFTAHLARLPKKRRVR